MTGRSSRIAKIRCVTASVTLQLSQLLDLTRQPRLVWVVDIQLIPPRDIPAATLAEQQLERDAEPFEQSGRSNHVLGHHIRISLLLDSKFLEAPDALIVAAEDTASEQAVDP